MSYARLVKQSPAVFGGADMVACITKAATWVQNLDSIHLLGEMESPQVRRAILTAMLLAARDGMVASTSGLTANTAKTPSLQPSVWSSVSKPLAKGGGVAAACTTAAASSSALASITAFAHRWARKLAVMWSVSQPDVLEMQSNAAGGQEGVGSNFTWLASSSDISGGGGGGGGGSSTNVGFSGCADGGESDGRQDPVGASSNTTAAFERQENAILNELITASAWGFAVEYADGNERLTVLLNAAAAAHGASLGRHRLHTKVRLEKFERLAAPDDLTPFYNVVWVDTTARMQQCCSVLLNVAAFPATNSAVGIDLEWRDPRPCSLLQVAVNTTVYTICLLPVKAGVSTHAGCEGGGGDKDRTVYYSLLNNAVRLLCCCCWRWRWWWWWWWWWC